MKKPAGPRYLAWFYAGLVCLALCGGMVWLALSLMSRIG